MDDDTFEGSMAAVNAAHEEMMAVKIEGAEMRVVALAPQQKTVNGLAINSNTTRQAWAAAQETLLQVGIGG